MARKKKNNKNKNIKANKSNINTVAKIEETEVLEPLKDEGVFCVQEGEAETRAAHAQAQEAEQIQPPEQTQLSEQTQLPELIQLDEHEAEGEFDLLKKGADLAIKAKSVLSAKAAVHKTRAARLKTKTLALSSKAYKATASGLKELRSTCLKNKKCALSAAMAGLSLAIGLTALLSLGSPALSGTAEREVAPQVVNTAEPLVHNHREASPAKALSHYTKLSVTGVPMEVGLAQPSPLVLFTKAEAAPEYKPGDSCAVSYNKTLSGVTKALNLESPFNVFKTVYNLRVNGEIVASFKTPNEGKQVMDKIAAMNTGEKSEIVKLEYKENVDITKDEASFLDDNTYSKVDDAVNFLMTGTKEMKKYSIVAGDIPETIAEAHGMTIDELEAANPSIVGRGHLLQIGEELNLVIPKPLINVMTTERRSYVKNVDYEVVETEDEEMYEGEVVVQEEGEYGRSEVVAEVVRENGREISRTILSEKVLKEPKKEVVTVGTKPAPPRRGSGYLDYPLQRGFEVSSPFGMRWGFLHSGIDLACPLGTPIVAADGGVVTFAGWDSIGGLMVKIDHGGNISTGYAHCGYLAVSEGEMVFKGQYIADVGMTGFTTGPHLHFEVLYDGVHTDPSEYLAFY